MLNDRKKEKPWAKLRMSRRAYETDRPLAPEANAHKSEYWPSRCSCRALSTTRISARRIDAGSGQCRFQDSTT